MKDKNEGEAVIVLATKILTEEKNMLTLTQEEYALLSGEPWGGHNPAVAVSGEKFNAQIAYAEQRLQLAVAYLKKQATVI
jgi:hypothetical protein